MEDQPVEAGALTSGAAPAATSDSGEVPAATPQGKTARNRHRLPRIRAAEAQIPEPETVVAEVPQTVVAEPDTVVAEPDTVVAEPDTVVAEDELVDESTSDEVDEPTVEPEPEPVPVLVSHRPAGRALKLAAIVAGAVFVGAAAFAGASAQPYLVDRARESQKFEVAQTAANAISTLWTYAPDNIDKLPDRAAKFLSGDFANEYRKFIDAIVAPNKQAQVTNETQVVGAAVESLTPTEATAIVYTNSVASSPASKGVPAMRYLSYRLTMVPHDGRWLITKMNAVTQLDLTPRV